MNSTRIKEQIAALGRIDEFTWPAYADGSIANVPATVAALLDVPFQGLSPLREGLWRPLLPGVKRVVLVILDALGSNLLAQEADGVAWLREKTAVSGQITSIFPSTTVAALSSLWTGAAPARHGLVGLTLFFPQFATAGQMLAFTPAFRRFPDALIDAGLQPEEFLAVPGFAEQLAAGGVPTYAFKGAKIIDSALSKMHGRGVTKDVGIKTAADMFVRLRELLEEKTEERLYACAYWPTIDTLSHDYAWTGASVAAELHTLLAQFDKELLQALSPAARRETAVFLVADHGQVPTPPEQHIFLDDHPQLQEMLFMRPVGEPRVAYLYARHGRQQAIINYINENLSHAMIALSAEAVLQAGLLGPDGAAPVAAERIGDVVAIMRAGYAFLMPHQKEHTSRMLGRHGSMTTAEMMVPWWGFRLD